MKISVQVALTNHSYTKYPPDKTCRVSCIVTSKITVFQSKVRVLNREFRGDSEEPLPGELPKNCTYIPINQMGIDISCTSTRRCRSTMRSRPSTSFRKQQERFPVLKPDKLMENPFSGAKRSFVVAHDHRSKVAKRVEEMNWRSMEKTLARKYNLEIAKLTTNIKIRDGETLRRLNKARPKKGEVFIAASTGPRMAKKLPREIQDTTYPRNHYRYFGV